jgi:hypothetical protein
LGFPKTLYSVHQLGSFPQSSSSSLVRALPFVPRTSITDQLDNPARVWYTIVRSRVV